MKNKLLIFGLIALFAMVQAIPASALNNTVLYLHKDVTTHVVFPESIKFVDISTNYVVGNQCADNIVRIKPRQAEDGEYADYLIDDMAQFTIIGERSMAQISLKYVQTVEGADGTYYVTDEDMTSYVNPAVSMSKGDMAKYCWYVYKSGRKFNNITAKKTGINARINNIYAVGDYFFIDYTLKNKTKIPYDMADMRISVADKKQSKATNVQSTEIFPVFRLFADRKFNKEFRNVIVIPKLTFPDEKVLNIEFSEEQISGRTVTLTIEYADILNLDGFPSNILDN